MRRNHIINISACIGVVLILFTAISMIKYDPHAVVYILLQILQFIGSSSLAVAFIKYVEKEVEYEIHGIDSNPLQVFFRRNSKCWLVK